MGIDLGVLGHDPRFGGGSLALTEAFLQGARDLGREPELLYAPHPVLAGKRLTPDRIEAIRQLRAARRLEPAARSARSLWAVASYLTAGGAAPRTGRSYNCWAATSIEDEWRGRAPGLGRLHRLAFDVSLPTLRRIERDVLQGATRVYAMSHGSRLVVAEAAGRDDVEILPIPVDLDVFSPEPDDAWQARLERPVVVFVGRAWDPRKNVGLLLAAWPEIRRRVPGATLRLFGEPPRVPLPEGVEAPGRVEMLGETLRESALFVLPSRQEGFGIVAAEALAAGVPVLSTRSGGPDELVERSGGGRLLDTLEPEELAATAAGLLEDVGTLIEMRKQGRAYVEREHAPAVFRERLAAALAD